MASKLMQYYEDAKSLGGLKAQMRLAVLTRVPGPSAQSAPDSPENLTKFEQAMQEIRKEF